MNSTFWETLVDFLTSNQEPTDYRIPVAMATVAMYSIISFVVFSVLKSLRNIDVLTMQRYTVIKGLLWVIGATMVCFVLITIEVIAYNLVSFLVVSMVWDVIYKRLFEQAKDKSGDIGTIDSLE